VGEVGEASASMSDFGEASVLRLGTSHGTERDRTQQESLRRLLRERSGFAKRTLLKLQDKVEHGGVGVGDGGVSAYT